MQNSIAIIGMACCYPDARSPEELWENVLSQRRAFRQLPAERLNLNDYFSEDRLAPDKIYSKQAAVIEGFEFDRVKFKVAGKTFRSSDWTHWLALDVAEKAFADANFLENKNLPNETTGVFLGNTLTGEFSRANTIRLRYPFVKRVVEDILQHSDIPKDELRQIINKLEKNYKKPFPEITEESLAGGLSNTIAGRICNYFDLKGGGYTVDGACSSSLLAVANACSSLVLHDVDVALVGGVDLSIDPFELIGFAKTGALTEDVMRVYDTRSQGFIPGEGCGFVLLMREKDAIEQQLKIYATIRGWGISSDGSGGITRPEVEGQKLALQRAYNKAGFGIETISYFEGHGTGTTVGDATELKALSAARRDASEKTQSAVISSIKSLIGHTKAAAGIAGLIKAVMALKYDILPPTTGCENPHSEINCEKPTLRILQKGEVWGKNHPKRAAVSSMGFGGINAHIVLEKSSNNVRSKLSHREKTLISSKQDSELFLFADNSLDGLLDQIEQISNYAGKLSLAELGDLSVELAQNLRFANYRCAVVASTPSELESRLNLFTGKIKKSEDFIIDADNQIFFGGVKRNPRIGFLFSGQGSPSNLDGGLWCRRFESASEFYVNNAIVSDLDTIQTQIAQPAIVKASIVGLQILDKFDITAQVGIGHSLGELTALYWAEAFDAETLLEIAEKRGQAMSETTKTKGAMLSVSASIEEIEGFLQNYEKVVVAGFNTPNQTVVSGEEQEILHLHDVLQNRQINSIKLPVSHAFHSPLVANSASCLEEFLESKSFQPLQKDVFSTVRGQKLCSDENLWDLLIHQIVNPVQFLDAVEAAEKSGIDLWIEVGTGKILCGLIEKISQTPAISLQVGSESLSGLWQAVGASFAFGQRINQRELFAERFTKPFDLNWKPKFFTNPCELAPLPNTEIKTINTVDDTFENSEDFEFEELIEVESEELSPSEIVTKLIADKAELPVSAISLENRMLSDLHLNSITVGQIVTSAAKRLGAIQPLSPTEFADSTVTEIIAALEKYKNFTENENPLEQTITGLDDWVRPFEIKLVEKNLIKKNTTNEKGSWQIFSQNENKFADKIREQIGVLNGNGVIICVTGEAVEEEISILLQGAKSIIEQHNGKFVLVQDKKSFAGFAKSFALENPKIPTIVIQLPFANENSIEWLFDEISSNEEYVEVHYLEDGRRFEPLVESIKLSNELSEISLSEKDVLLVSGGAKGITAECVLALAKETNVKLALLGTSDCQKNREVSINLERLRASNINFKYYSNDITDKDAVKTVVQNIEKDLGKITGIFHCAAKNEPILVQNLDESKINETLSVKIDGLKNLLSAFDTSQLKIFVTFGSIIARTGLQGESAYGLANEWLTDLTKNFQDENPNCRCIAFEWSVWSGVGMGSRVADLDLLIRQGIHPIPLEKGVQTFIDMLKQKDLPTSFILMNRFQDIPTFKISHPKLPFWRFLEEPKVFYPNIELIVDVEISSLNDPYLEDHKIGGERVLPAVMGMEAMAEVSMALMGKTSHPKFQNLKFSKPIVINENEPLKIRILALAETSDKIKVAIRTAETQFQVNHFEGVCNFAIHNSSKFVDKEFELNGHSKTKVELNPKEDLYGKILFHQGRFQRLANYKHLEAKKCIAEITNGDKSEWFSRYLPKDLLLGDPAMRDTAIHAIQACIPHATLLPIGVDEIFINQNGHSESKLVYAQERSKVGNVFIYDLQVMDSHGSLFESWKGLHLQTVQGKDFTDVWSEPLLAVYLERKIGELLNLDDVSIALLNEPNLERRASSQKAFKQIVSDETEIIYRSDGKPETNNGIQVSASHCENLTLAVACKNQIACDIETVSEKDAEIWKDLLGEDGFQLAEKVSKSINEAFDISATRIWSAKECVQKINSKINTLSPLSFVIKDDWILFELNNIQVISYETHIKHSNNTLIISILCFQ